MSHYEQFVSMLNNAQTVSPMVFRRKSVNFTADFGYQVVEMESGAGRILFGFNKTTGELVDVMGPCRRKPETPIPMPEGSTDTLETADW
jgi:hypothetical protein